MTKEKTELSTKEKTEPSIKEKTELSTKEKTKEKTEPSTKEKTKEKTEPSTKEKTKEKTAKVGQKRPHKTEADETSLPEPLDHSSTTSAKRAVATKTRNPKPSNSGLEASHPPNSKRQKTADSVKRSTTKKASALSVAKKKTQKPTVPEEASTRAKKEKEKPGSAVRKTVKKAPAVKQKEAPTVNKEEEEEEEEEGEGVDNDQHDDNEEQEEEDWVDWKRFFFCGTEWENYDKIFKFSWNFNHLFHDLKNDLIRLSKTSRSQIYLFGMTEPQLLKLHPRTNPDKETMAMLPVIIAVESQVPLPNFVSITSVMRAEEEILPMHSLKINWLPWIPGSEDNGGLRRKKTKKEEHPQPEYLYLQCSQRRTSLNVVPTSRKKDYEYALLWLPAQDQDDEDEEDTLIHIVDSIAGLGLNFEFDWKFDDMAEVISQVLEERQLDPERYKDELEALISSKVREAKEAKAKEKEKKMSILKKFKARELECWKSLRSFKYYPTYRGITITKSPFINRYYNKANCTKPEDPSPLTDA